MWTGSAHLAKPPLFARWEGRPLVQTETQDKNCKSSVVGNIKQGADRMQHKVLIRGRQEMTSACQRMWKRQEGNHFLGPVIDLTINGVCMHSIYVVYCP